MVDTGGSETTSRQEVKKECTKEQKEYVRKQSKQCVSVYRSSKSMTFDVKLCTIEIYNVI